MPNYTAQDVVVVYPTLRPQAVSKCIFALKKSTSFGELVIVTPVAQSASIPACLFEDKRIHVVNDTGNSVTQAMNLGVHASSRPLIVYYSDDMFPVAPHEWITLAAHQFDIGDKPPFLLGFNDLVHNGHIATIGMASRYFIDQFLKGKLYNDCYTHNCCDTETTEIARLLNGYRFCKNIVFEHQHPAVSRIYPSDFLHERARKANAADRQLFNERKLRKFDIIISQEQA